MRQAHRTWSFAALVLVGAFLPWAEVDMRAVVEESMGLSALATRVAAGYQPRHEATAWNSAVQLGTAKIPIWVALVVCLFAAVASTLRRRGVHAIPHAVRPILAAFAVGLLFLFGLEDSEVSRLLPGYWVTALGTFGVTAAVARGKDPRFLQSGAARSP